MNEQRDQTDANSYTDGDKEGEAQLSRLESLCTFVDNVQTIADRDDDMEKGVTTGHVAPDGGFEAWLQVFGGVLIAVNTWGLINMWGTFQTYYSSQTPPLASGSAISWIGSIQSFLLLFVGALCGRPFDLGYSKHMTWSGTAIMTIAILLTSLSGEFGGHRGNQVYYQVLLSQGVLLGLGMGLTLIPQVAIVSSYFTSKRGLAVSIVTVGGSVGGVIYPIVFRRLVVKVGFHWSMRIFALIVCVGLVSASLILKQRKDIIDRRAKDEESQGFIRRLVSVLKFLKSITWRDWPYLVYVFAMFWTSMCLYCPFYYIERFTIDVGMDMEGLDTVYLISIMNAGGAFGRVVAGLLADVLGPVTTQLIFILLGTITLFSWLSITTVAPLIAFSAIYGFFAGAIIALPPASIAKLTSNISVLGTRLGVMFLAYGLATLSGPPIAGRLAGMGDKKGESAAKIYMGAVMLTAGVVIAWSRWLKVGCSLKKAI